MPTLKELIRQCPELGEAFADFENRLFYLENRHIPTEEELNEVIRNGTQPARPQPTIISASDVQMAYLWKNLIERIDKKIEETLKQKRVDKEYEPF